MPADLFYHLGRMTGVQLRKAKWFWASVAGDEADAIRAEQGVGRDMAAVVLEDTPRDPDPGAQALLGELGERLGARVRNPLHRFETTCIQADNPTAFAVPGGFVFLSRSLVTLCDRDPDELAFVIGHEMAHVIRRHAIDRLIEEKILSAAARISPGRGVLASWIRRVGIQSLERAYSQDREFEADELGLLLARAAGFDPAGAVRVLERLQAFQKPDPLKLGAYLSTHPPTAHRIVRLKELGSGPRPSAR